MRELSDLGLAALAAAFALVAALYATVGHGGASGYLAVATLFSVQPEAWKPGALVLNVLVSGTAAVAFARAGHLRWGLVVPFAGGSVPAAFVGASLAVSARLYSSLLAFALLAAAARLAWRGKAEGEAPPRSPTLPVALPVGAAIGLLAGITGVGGGIFLSPLLLLLGWATPKQTAAASAVFIAANSVSGLAGHLARGAAIPIRELALPIVAAWSGGIVGSVLGARRFSGLLLRRILAIVLLVAAGKLLLAVP